MPSIVGHVLLQLGPLATPPGIIGTLVVLAIIILVGRLLLKIAWRLVLIGLVVVVVLWLLGILGFSVGVF